MKFNRNLLLTALGLACSGMVLAADAPPPRETSIAVGYVGTTGNTDTKTFNTEILLTLRSDPWTHNAKFQALAAQENSTSKAERYFLEEKSDYALDAQQYLFGKGSYLDDRFSGYDYQATVAGGYGRYLIRDENLTLEAFGGPGYRQNAISTASSEGEAILSLGQKLEWTISDSSKFVQSLNSDIGDDLTLTVFEMGLVSQIIDRIATKIAFQARNLSEVPVGI
ncbi:MAG: DUF481 domain-containing protein, partial [Pseudomonadota bacterium]